MATETVQWLLLLLFVLLFVGFIAVEILWLSKKGWTTGGKAAAFSLITNVVSFGIGFGLVFTLITVMFVLTMGPTGKGGDTSAGVFFGIVLSALFVPPFLFFAFKRIMLAVLKIRSGKSAWIYSLVSSIVFFFAVIAPSPALFYISTLIWK